VFNVPKYLPAAGKKALAQRFLSLARANVPSACPVYPGLARPSDRSPEHALVTYAIADLLAAGTWLSLPTFNTMPSPALRALTAASWGRTDAILAGFDDFPGDLASDLWWRVKCVTDKPRTLLPAQLAVACNLLIRLGYPARAARLLELSDANVAERPFDPQLALTQFRILYYRSADRDALEERALEAAKQSTIPPQARLAMAIYVIVRNGMRRTETSPMRKAAEIASLSLEEFTATPFEQALARHRLFRATSFLPFVRGDAAETFRHLEVAAESLESVSPKGYLEKLAWDDHAYPMYETLAKTHILIGDTKQAIAASERLLGISRHDHRTWDTRGRCFLAAGRLAEALEAYRQAIPLGGHPVGEAAYHVGWISEQLGRSDDARDAYMLSLRIDPTVNVVRDRLSVLG
jgi:tetratricopeptide (TPR) repeat protein